MRKISFRFDEFLIDMQTKKNGVSQQHMNYFIEINFEIQTIAVGQSLRHACRLVVKIQNNSSDDGACQDACILFDSFALFSREEAFLIEREVLLRYFYRQTPRIKMRDCPITARSWLIILLFQRSNIILSDNQRMRQFIINNPIMNKSYLAIALLLAAATVLYTMEPSTNSEKSQYLAYLRKFNKPIPNAEELVYRSRLYAEYLIKMEKHNSDPSQKWQMGVNQFSDLTHEQFVSTYLGEVSNIRIVEFNEPVNKGFTQEIDWRTKNVVTAVKNQGQCGSCWAFGATAAHESYQVQFKNQPLTISLSEQQLVDCSSGSPYNNNGCNGGYGVRALEWIKDHGQTTSAEYPYKAVDQTCASNSGSYKIFGIAEVAGCEQIEEVIKRRPMAVRVDASNWHLYRSGIFDNCAKNINHAVFLVGTSETAWTIKNSWATTWGESGYIRLAKGDTCAVCQGPSFAI